MTQPEKPATARGARPQLFGAPSAGRARQPDFGPSILATIDGNPRRDVRSRQGASTRRVLVMSLVALVIVGAYFGMKLGAGQGTAASGLVTVQPQAPVPVVAKVSETVAPEPAQQAASQASPDGVGVASIENVAAPAQPVASASQPAQNVAASMSNIQQVLARAEATEPRKAVKPPAPAPKETPVVAPAPSPAPMAAKSGKDSDADLLAAMLPHLKRSPAAPTSPAYEKRCGKLTGDAAVDCRAKFCNGREDKDAACPVVAR